MQFMRNLNGLYHQARSLQPDFARFLTKGGKFVTHYQLTFTTSNGGRRSFRVNNVNPAITPADLQAAVDALLAHDIMCAERGALYRLQSLTANTVSTTNPLD